MNIRDYAAHSCGGADWTQAFLCAIDEKFCTCPFFCNLTNCPICLLRCLNFKFSVFIFCVQPFR